MTDLNHGIGAGVTYAASLDHGHLARLGWACSRCCPTYCVRPHLWVTILHTVFTHAHRLLLYYCAHLWATISLNVVSVLAVYNPFSL